MTGGKPSAFACLAVSMKYANEISKEVLWEHLSVRFSKSAWLPEVLTLWFSFSEETVFLAPSAEGLWEMRPEWVQGVLSIFWLHFSCSQVSGTCKWKTCWGSTWLISNFCSVPLPHWPLNYLLLRPGLRGSRWEAGGSLQYGWHGVSLPTAGPLAPPWRLWQSTAGWPGSLGSEWEKLVLY